jgi:hypothetical protein
MHDKVPLHIWVDLNQKGRGLLILLINSAESERDGILTEGLDVTEMHRAVIRLLDGQFRCSGLAASTRLVFRFGAGRWAQGATVAVQGTLVVGVV